MVSDEQTASPGYRVTSIAELQRPNGWSPIRRELGVRSFGINTWTTNADEQVIPAHDEAPSRHEELYLVTSGRATFTVGDEEIDAPAGTIVHVPDPTLRRGAVAREDNTTVLAVGAEPGEVYRPLGWEINGEVLPLFDSGQIAEARRLLEEAVEYYGDEPDLHYNLACADALLGDPDSAFAHLRLALDGSPRLAEVARTDSDLESLQGDPRFAEMAGPG
jgi:quercetin dioxygenase-like cupin family protein